MISSIGALFLTLATLLLVLALPVLVLYLVFRSWWDWAGSSGRWREASG